MRTSVNGTVVVPDTVAVTPPSNAYGTSTPCVLRPSDRTYSTWYCVSVIELFTDGWFGDVGDPGSLSASVIVARPWSDAIDCRAVIGSTLSTSDSRMPPNVVDKPGAPSSELRIKY